MKKQFWLEPSQTSSEEDIRKKVLDVRPYAVLLPKPVPGLQPVKVASPIIGGDILVAETLEEIPKARTLGVPVAIELTVHDRKDYATITNCLSLKPDYVVVNCPDWKIIPVENLIAETRDKTILVVKTTSFEESRIFLSTLELGTDGICLKTNDYDEVLKTRDLIQTQTEEISLSTAKVTHVKQLGTGARVCVDTCELLQADEGLLTGSSSQGLFLIEGEIHSNDHVNPRPFRINAGPISSYVLGPNGSTRYLSELAAGEPVLLVNRNGRTRTVDVARIKIERRPLTLVEATVGSRIVKTIVQNAETVRFVTEQGSKPISQIQLGDKVLVRIEQGGRHFGMKVTDEMIIEK
jgi:3-dehydroquinate synthase II